MSLINISNLTFCYDGSADDVFNNVSFQIDTDWKLGFTGRNGRGKTTFLKLLMGKYEYRGSITASVDFEYFPFEVCDKCKNTIDVLYEINGDFEMWELLRELSKLAVDEDVLYRPFNSLSNGEQTKTLLAVMILKENSFLLIDEPTNHLDRDARETVAKYLGSKKGFILVSHDRVFLDTCVDHILSINKANIEIQQGNFSSWYHNKQLRDNFEAEKNAKLKKEIKRLTETAREKARWANEAEGSKIGFDPSKVEKSIGRRAGEAAKSKKMMKRSKVIEGHRQAVIDEKSKLLKNLEEAQTLKLYPLFFHSKRLTELNGVSLFYGEKRVCSDVSVLIERGDRVALCGKNGCGKSSVIKLICGEDIGFTGEYFKAIELNISYVEQDASGLSGCLADYERRYGIDGVLFRAILRKLDFSRAQFEKDIKDYSEGQKKKVMLARSLCEQAHLYVWDEPLNYIDVMSRIQIEELIKEYRPTLLFVEHDKMFCDNIATKSVNL